MPALPGHTSEQRTGNKPKNNPLTGKAPYKFESGFLQRRVSCKPDFLVEICHDQRNPGQSELATMYAEILTPISLFAAYAETNEVFRVRFFGALQFTNCFTFQPPGPPRLDAELATRPLHDCPIPG
jgi:hypothetical protein